MTDTLTRARRVLAGLVYGDGHSYAALWNRQSLLPWRKHTFYAEAPTMAFEKGHTTQTHPHRHSAPTGTWQITGPTDTTEWVVVSALSITGGSLDGTGAPVWADLAQRRADEPAAVRARLGTAYALQNIHRGLAAPASGNDTPHYFDDQGCIRAVVPALLAAGDPDRAAALAGDDVAHTHSLDGLWCAQGAAALLAAGLGGEDVREATRAAVRHLPTGTWSANVVAECLAQAELGQTPADLADRLEQNVLDDIYSYNVSAPETLGALLAHLAVADGPEALLAGALAHPRANATLVPLAAVAAVVFFGDQWLPHRLRTQLPVLDGSSVRALRGRDLEDVAALLAAA